MRSHRAMLCTQAIIGETDGYRRTHPDGPNLIAPIDIATVQMLLELETALQTIQEIMPAPQPQPQPMPQPEEEQENNINDLFNNEGMVVVAEEESDGDEGGGGNEGGGGT